MKKIISLVDRMRRNYFNLTRLQLDFLTERVINKDVEASFFLGMLFMKEGQGVPFPDYLQFPCPSFDYDPAMEFFNEGINLIKFSSENGYSFAEPLLNYFLFELDMLNIGKQNPFLIDKQYEICRGKILDDEIYKLFNGCE